MLCYKYTEVISYVIVIRERGVRAQRIVVDMICNGQLLQRMGLYLALIQTYKGVLFNTLIP